MLIPMRIMATSTSANNKRAKVEIDIILFIPIICDSNILPYENEKMPLNYVRGIFLF